MKHYKSYMDRIQLPEELHGKLLDLEGQRRTFRRPAWRKYAALAACAALLMGAGVYGAGRMWRHSAGDAPAADWSDPFAGGFGPSLDRDPVISAEVIDLAPADGDDIQPGMKTIPGYEVTENRAGVDVAVYYVLPYIAYGDPGAGAAGQIALDWDIPGGATRRDLAADEIAALLGGGDAVSTHLDWDSYELTGWAAWYEDGSFWGTYLHGYAGPLDHFEFAVTAGQLPPTCIAFPDSVEQEIWGVTVTADKHDGQNGCDRRVSFMADGFGYRFDLTATGGSEAAEKLVSRVVRRMVADGGVASNAVTPDGLAPADPNPAPSQPWVNADAGGPANGPGGAAAPSKSPEPGPAAVPAPSPSVGPGAGSSPAYDPDKG